MGLKKEKIMGENCQPLNFRKQEAIRYVSIQRAELTVQVHSTVVILYVNPDLPTLFVFSCLRYVINEEIYC